MPNRNTNPSPATTPNSQSSHSPQSSPPQVGAKGGARLCGKGRTVGGVYIESSPESTNLPTMATLVDPPRVIDPKRYGLAAQGMAMVEIGGVWHLMDQVGEQYYSVSDFIEEARRMGVSRKVAPNSIDWGKITPASQLFLVHAKAVVQNAAAYEDFIDKLYCPTNTHTAGDPCLGLHYYQGIVAKNHPSGRKLVDGHYPLLDMKEGHETPRFLPGIFMRVPIERIAMIQHKNELVLKAKVPTAVVEY